MPDVNLLDNLATQCLHRLPESTPDQFSITLSGFAKMGYIPGTPLLAAAAESAAAALSRGPQGLGPREMAELMWSFAKCEYRPPEALLQRVLQKFAQSLGVMPGQRISQLLWAFAQFGCAPPGAVLTSIMQSATAALATYPPDSMSQLLAALRSFGCALASGPLLQAAAERAASHVSGFGGVALADLLEVFAGCRFHPGIDLLHAAAQQLSEQLSAAEAAGAPPPLPARAAASVVRSYATLAYAPPTQLLQQLQALLLQQLGELDAADLASVLWGYQLFHGLTPALWNPACEALAAGQAEGVQAQALVQLFQVHLMVCRDPACSAYETPPALIVAARGHWVAHVSSSAMLPPGEVHRDVQRCLAGMGVPHTVGSLGEDGMFTLKLALPDRRIALEALGPDAFCVNVQPPQQQPQPLGETVMRIHMLAAHGWQSLSIPHYEWSALTSEVGKQQYLRTLMGM